MKQFLILLISLGFYPSVYAQEVPFELSVEEVFVPGSPGLQSFVWATSAGKILLIGGRTDGLHQRQPFASFLADGNNTVAYVMDIEAAQVWSADLSGLNTALYEQLQSTNMEFDQVGDQLMIIGGYGFSPTANDHITFPYLTVVEVPGLIEAIQNGEEGMALSGFFRQLEDERMAVTGGQLGYLDGSYYLAGGQYFEGRYNPMGPDHGPGFIQNYTDAIRKFTLLDDGQNLSIGDYEEWLDTPGLHRRDYNMLPQVFPDGTNGFTMFSGVFQMDENIPWHNTVNVLPEGHTVHPGFDQMLNQYHSAHVPLYDAGGNAMHSVFFGGMSRYYFNEFGDLIDDVDVPFVTTISRVTRHADGTMDEVKLGVEMPGLLGASAEFVPAAGLNMIQDKIISLDNLPDEPSTIGYVIGGIESTEANIFFINTGNESTASNRIFKITIDKGTVGLVEQVVNGALVFEAEVFPNPAKERVNLEFMNPGAGAVKVDLINERGQLIEELINGFEERGELNYEITFDNFSPGSYYLRISNGAFSDSLRLILE